MRGEATHGDDDFGRLDLGGPAPNERTFTLAAEQAGRDFDPNGQTRCALKMQRERDSACFFFEAPLLDHERVVDGDPRALACRNGTPLGRQNLSDAARGRKALLFR